MTFFDGGSPHLHECKFDGPLKETHLGQARIAGTGPKGKTCLNCVHFGMKGKDGRIESPGYYGKGDKTRGGTLKTAKCNASIPHKANRRFPHSAKSCLLFAETQEPFLTVSRKD